ncbi:hypothetical protein HK405_005503 [Cladochytrium tenue]|nr:hypothetical protein HK405_005503 [Cladochytrium tenue]
MPPTVPVRAAVVTTLPVGVTVDYSTYPVANLAVYPALQRTREFLAGNAIILDATASVLPDPSATYYYLFDFGDGTAPYLTSKSGTPPVVSHVFATSGTFTTRLRVSDASFASGAAGLGTYIAVTAGGLPVYISAVTISVLTASTCYSYNESIYWNSPDSNGVLATRVLLAVVDSAWPFDSARSRFATQAFRDASGDPIGVLRNASFEYAVSFNWSREV